MPPATYQLGADVEKTKSAEVHSQIVQQFEISNPIAKACWYTDGTQIYPKGEADFESQGCDQALRLQSGVLSGDGRHETAGDAQLNTDMTGGVPHCTCIFIGQMFSCTSDTISRLIFFFLFGFVQTAEQCHYGDAIGEVADSSAQKTVDVKGDLIYFNISHLC